MVRKKLKRVSQSQHPAPEYSGTQGGGGDGHSNNLRTVVETWFKHLNIALGADPLPPPVSPRLDVFGVLTNSEGGPFAQVRSLQGLRSRLQKIAAAHEKRPDAWSAADHVETVTRTAERQELNLVFLISLLLYMDTDTGSLRKAIKGLLLTAEKAAISMGSTSTDNIVLVVFDRFLDRSLEVTSTILPTAATRVSTCATATEGASGVLAATASGLGKVHAQVGVSYSEAESMLLDPYASRSKASEAESADCTVRIARSLQWLVDTPGGKRILLDNTSGGADNLAESELGYLNIPDSGKKLSLFGKSFALLDLLLQTQTGSTPTGSSTTGVVGGAEHYGGDEGDGAPNCPRFDGSACSLDSCSEVLKATACLMSLNKHWEVGHVHGGKSMALRVGAVCLRVLSTPAATRETITHASNALISVVVASWRSDGLWPGGTPTAGFNTTNRGAGTSLAECRRTPPTTDDCEEAVDSFDAACTILRKAFFPAWQEQCSPQRRRRQKDRIAVSKGDDASVLIASFMPLPPRATLAVCRAIIHAVSPGVLLARVLSNAEEIHEETNEDGGKCLLTGPVLREILQWCGANSALQLRFLGLQVLEAWCGISKTLVESDLSMKQQLSSTEALPGSNQDRDVHHSDLGQALVEVMEVAMSALVHPSKLVSSIAPVLLEHVIHLRQLARELSGTVRAGRNDEWERLVGRVLSQSVSSKARYIALTVLLPRVGALRLLELGPPLVDELVWAVGARGNVSGHATSFLLQLITAATQELKSAEDRSAEDRSASTLPGQDTAVYLCRRWWVGPAADALIQEDSWSRGRVAAYLLPEVFKLDPGSVVSLFHELRERLSRLQNRTKRGSDMAVEILGVEGSAMEPEVCCVWAMLEVARHARKSGAMKGVAVISTGSACNLQPGASTRTPGLLERSEVEWSALHMNETLRMSAISLLCTDPRITTVPSPAETSLLKAVLPHSLKVYGAQNRQVLLRGLQILLSRMRETLRVCAKEQSDERRLRKRDATNDGGTAASAAAGDGKEAEELPKDTINRVEDMVRWLCQVVLESLYPGCPFEREVLGLEVLQLVLSELLPSEGKGRRQAREPRLAKVVSSELFCRRWADTLLALLGSSWDRTRSLSYSILARFPRPLPGYGGCDGAIRLYQEGLRLSGSGRQRESERGALILRLVYISSVCGLDLDVSLLLSELKQVKDEVAVGGSEVCGGRAETAEGGAPVKFLGGLCSVLTHRVDGIERSFNALLDSVQRPSTSPSTTSTPLAVSLESTLFPHGILLAIHHVLLDSTMESGSNEPRKNEGTPKQVERNLSPEVKAAPGVPDRPRKKVVDRQARGWHEVMILLLNQALRALQLSLLIVGEHNFESSSFVFDNAQQQQPEPGGDVGPECAPSGDTSASVGSVAERGIGSDQAEGAHKTAIHAVASAGRSSRSVNANGHMGGIAFDHRRRIMAASSSRVGMDLSSSKDAASSKSNTSTEGEATGAQQPRLHPNQGSGPNDGSEKLVEGETGQSSGAAEGQRAVVGAWLLAKESCRCLATIVTTCGIPPSSSHGTAGSDTADESSSPSLADTAQLEGESGGNWMLGERDVMRIGEALLDSLLALKHMGCVAFAQGAFQTVCEELLRAGSRNTRLSLLPSLWLNKLLERLTEAEHEFVLRRSAGLATAFIAILRAEPRSVAPVLLPRGMHRLVALAQAPAHSHDWRGRVHALNVLRLVFIDSTLADDIGPYVTEALMSAVCGFEDAEWAVRNSSMMLFASIMQRAVGGAKNAAMPSTDGTRRPHSARDAVTAQAFFQQHARLHPFLLEKLEGAASHTTICASGGSGDGPEEVRGARNRAEMHPVLYPILLLLARLRGSGEAVLEDVETEHAAEAGLGNTTTAASASPKTSGYDRQTIAAFVPLVTTCGGNPHFSARAASARALAAIVSPAESPGLILDLLRRLPRDSTGLRNLEDGTASHNKVHGTLLQALELIKSSQVAPQPNSAQIRLLENDEPHSGSPIPQHPSKPAAPTTEPHLTAHQSPGAIAERIAAAAYECIWLADPACLPCPPIRLVMLSVLEALDDWLQRVYQSTSEDPPVKNASCESRRSIRSALRKARESNLEEAIRPGATGRLVPGQSLLASFVVDVGVRQRLDAAFLGESEGVLETERANRRRVRDGKEGQAGADDDDDFSEGIERASLRFVVNLLSHADVDVRDAAIKASKKWFGSRSLRRSTCDTKKAQATKLQLRETAMLELWVAAAQALTSETHPPNIRRLLRLLSRAGLWLRGDDSCLPKLKPAPPLWDHLCLLCDDTIGIGTGAGDIHAGALEVLGIVVRLNRGGVMRLVGKDNMATSRLGSSGASGAMNVGAYVRLLEDAASPGQPISTRVAAVQSLSSSGLLLLHHDWPVAGEASLASFVRAWFVLLSLMQDHDERVRACAARTCSTAGGEEHPRTSAQAGGTISGKSGSTRISPLASDCQALGQVQSVLKRLVSLAETDINDGERARDSAAEVVVLALLRTFSDIPGISLEELLEGAGLPGVGGEKDRSTNSDVQNLGGMMPDVDDVAYGGNSGGDGEEIFGREDRTHFEEPWLYARVAAPYLSRALVALGARRTQGLLPDVVMEGIQGVLLNLAEIVEGLTGLLEKSPSVTWLPGAYGGVTASLAMGAAVLEYISAPGEGSQPDASKLGGEKSQVGFVPETARVSRACALFEKACLCERRDNVHPDIGKGIAHVSRLAQKSLNVATARATACM